MSETMNKTQENVICEESFMYSIPYFFVKSSFRLTNKRIEGVIPNLLLFIPTGKDNATFPLNNVAQVKISTKFYLKSFIIGCIIALVGLSMFGDNFLGGLTTMAAGALILLNSFRTAIAIQNNGGSSMLYAIAPMEREKAQRFVDKINNIIAERI